MNAPMQGVRELVRSLPLESRDCTVRKAPFLAYLLSCRSSSVALLRLMVDEIRIVFVLYPVPGTDSRPESESSISILFTWIL
jgi:hypothetical protein